MLRVTVLIAIWLGCGLVAGLITIVVLLRGEEQREGVGKLFLLHTVGGILALVAVMIAFIAIYTEDVMASFDKLLWKVANIGIDLEETKEKEK